MNALLALADWGCLIGVIISGRKTLDLLIDYLARKEDQ